MLAVAMDLKIPPLGEEEAAGMAMMMPGFDPAKLKTLTAVADMVEKVFSLNAGVVCTDEEAAEGVVGGMKQMVNMANGLVGMMAAKQPEASKAFGELIRSVQISSDGASASLALTVTPELGARLKGLADVVKQMGAGAMGGGEMEMEKEAEETTEEVEED